MSGLRYLNSILTVLAVLLALNVWVLWGTTPGGEALSPANEAQAQGLVNAGQQRKDMIDLLKSINVKLNDVQQTLESGNLEVQVREAGGDED